MAGVAAVREHDDSRDALAAIPIAHRVDRGGEIGARRIGAEMVGRRGAKTLAHREQLGLELPVQARHQLPVQDCGRVADARLAVSVRQPHTARDVDEHRYDRVADAKGREERDGAKNEDHERAEHERPQRHERAALQSAQRHERPPIFNERQRRDTRREQQRKPPGQGVCEMH